MGSLQPEEDDLLRSVQALDVNPLSPNVPRRLFCVEWNRLLILKQSVVDQCTSLQPNEVRCLNQRRRTPPMKFHYDDKPLLIVVFFFLFLCCT